jgi:light-regulated signal transduction histidine kinase (bacteriophytochrome)
MFGLVTAKPIGGTARAVVGCPIGSVFNFVGHGFFDNYTRWSPQVVELQRLTDGPVGEGATARQVTVERGIRAESTFEITTFGPPKLLGIKGVSEPFKSFYAFEEQTAASTQLAFSFELEERDLFMRPFEALIRGTLQEGAQRTVENIKQLIESQHASASSPERLAQFIYVASLDLQEPLRKIESFSDLLENAIVSSNKRDIAYARQAMRSCALSARKLVDDLLTYSATILGEQDLRVLDLGEEIETALADLSESIIETNAEINLSIPSTKFVADGSQFACLMQNIISNAIKYHKPGQAPKIDIAAVAMGERSVRLTIVDYGVGFKEAFAQTIFEPLKKLHNTAEYPGTGIELAICKSIADRHGWAISVKSQPGEGALFSFTIPTLDRNHLPAGGHSTA